MNIITSRQGLALWVALSLAQGLSQTASAQAGNQASKNCIELKTEAAVEQTVTDAQGNKSIRLVPPGKIVPGTEVIYTITASNVCDKPATNVVVNNTVPEHMTYVMNTAMGVGTDMVFSLDGKSFARLDALAPKNADGTTRALRTDDIKAIRWTYSTAINPGQSGFVRYRARVN